MRQVFLLGALGTMALGCGGSAPAAQSANGTDSSSSDGSESAASSPGAQCLEDARAAREPKPDAPETIGVSHVLVRHAQLERPEGATRSPEQACLRALEALKALQSGELTWEEAVQKYSDSGSATAGSLGSVAKDQLSPAFADAAFALDVNELSYVVESDRGFHVILRTE